MNSISLIRQEFFKIKNTLAFRSAFIIPFLLNLLIVVAFITKAEEFIKLNDANIWYRYLSFILGVMGSLILPMYIIFLTFSINDIEHKADTWKNIFSYPIEKRKVFLSKWISSVLIFALFILSFYLFTMLAGIILGQIEPRFGFQNHSMWMLLFQAYLKLFISSIALLSLQFFFSMLWSDFMKSMGIGLLLTIASMIIFRWEYIYAIPYAQPIYSVSNLFEASKEVAVNFNSKEIYYSISTGLIFTALSYMIMKRKSIA